MESADFEGRTELSVERIDSLVSRNRMMFERMTGIHFQQQQEFHDALAKVVETGETSGDQLIHSSLDGRRNGSSTGAASWTTSELGNVL